MTALDPQRPVGQFVTERMDLARLFDRLGIDYCCGGRKPLAEACAEKGLDVRQVLLEIEESAARPADTPPHDWSMDSMSNLIDHIILVHHEPLRTELDRLAFLLGKVVEAHGQRHPELLTVRDIFGEFKSDLILHMLKEEKILFPMIKHLETAQTMPVFPFESVLNPVLVMEHEHSEAGGALERMRELTGGFRPPEDACVSYSALLAGLAEMEADLHRHVHKENNILFPRARRVEAALLVEADESASV